MLDGSRLADSDEGGVTVAPVVRQAVAAPILKWAGGKRQLLSVLLPLVPSNYRRFIEPMIGGGALFFALAPSNALIGDSNPELINLYRAVVSDLDSICRIASTWPVAEDTFYQVRSLKFDDLDPATAAARTLYLNRTCFNGLYRVNRRGEFNVPWGGARSDRIIDRSGLEAARAVLSRAEIVLSDYATLVSQNAGKGDVVFLDPPYLPISEFADFKRYTRDQFHRDDHIKMRALVGEISGRGCTTIITNSNHPLVFELYGEFGVTVEQTRRFINSNGAGRSGEDTIVLIPPFSLKA